MKLILVQISIWISIKLSGMVTIRQWRGSSVGLLFPPLLHPVGRLHLPVNNVRLHLVDLVYGKLLLDDWRESVRDNSDGDEKSDEEDEAGGENLLHISQTYTGPLLILLTIQHLVSLYFENILSSISCDIFSFTSSPIPGRDFLDPADIIESSSRLVCGRSAVQGYWATDSAGGKHRKSFNQRRWALSGSFYCRTFIKTFLRTFIWLGDAALLDCVVTMTRNYQISYQSSGQTDPISHNSCSY